MSRCFWPMIALLLCTTTTALADTYPRQLGVDVVHYAFRLTLNDENSEIVGETVISLNSKVDGLKELSLDLASVKEGGKGMTVVKVDDGAGATFTHEADRLKIAFLQPIDAGKSRGVTISYKGTPASGLLIGKNRYGDRTFFSENWPDKARQWLPVLDHPGDKATSEFRVTAPSSYQVVSNGLLQEELDLGDGRRITHWKQSVPIATWLNALAVAPFASHHGGTVRGVPVQTWVFRQDRDRLLAILEDSAKKAVELFSDKIGPYPYEKVAGVQAVGFDGGMELASAVFYGQFSLSGKGTPALVAHELAHQWFGDAVTEGDWDDVWLSEGFATFFAHVYAEKYEGREAYLAGLKRSRPIVFGSERRDPKTAVIHDNISDMRRVLNGLVYQKGAWILHMLREQVGEDAFWSGIRTYYAKFRDKNARTADFRRVMEESAKADLGWFFDQWLKRPGSPKVTWKWSFDPTAKRINVELKQEQMGDPYRLPLELAVSSGAGAPATIHRFVSNERATTVSFPCESEPASVALDPGSKILMDAAPAM